MKRGIILFGHGSRDPLWRGPIDAVAARVTALAPAVPVACAFLELTEPDLPGAVAALVEQGVDHITIVPMFLGVGRHARADLPPLVEALRARHPGLHVELQRSVGEDPRLIDLLAHMALG